jgi:SAM-dependent methyltransferase
LEEPPSALGIAVGDEFVHPEPGAQLGFDAMQAQVLAEFQQSQNFRMLRLCREWMLDAHGQIAIDAFEAIRDEVAPVLDAALQGNSSLEYAATPEAPTYWEGYEFHRSAGGWDGHDYMGFVHGELIHTHMVGRSLADVLAAQRLAAVREAPCESPAKILELGCASGQFTQALAETFPDADITALDLSARQLEQTLRRGNALGSSWHLLQAPAEQSGLDDEQFDLVCSYAVFHELPNDVARQVMSEMFRMCKPGAAMLMADVKPYSSLDADGVWNADFWNQMVGGDPFWREYAMTDFVKLAELVGFTDVAWRGLGEFEYPYVLTASKS